MEGEQYDERILFPRWTSHARPRLQIIRVFVDANGYLLFADKEKHRQTLYKHGWLNFLQQPHVLPDRKKAETFESYRHLSYFVSWVVNIRWDSRKEPPVLTTFETIEQASLAFGENPELFQLQSCPETRKRNAWIVFVKPKEEVLLSIANKKKRKIQLKSSMRKRSKEAGASSTTTTTATTRKKATIFGPRNPLDSESEQQFLLKKKARLTAASST